MKYVVLSQDQRIICFDHSDQVTEYCLEQDNDSLDEYCEERGYVYADMTPTEIGQLYVETGAVYGGCKIFETRDVLKEMKENGAEEEFIDEANHLFNDRSLNEEIPCPGFLEDILGELTPISPAQLSDGVNFMDNIDSPDDEKDNG